MTFEDIHDKKGDLAAIKCRVYRKDRSHPIEVVEYISSAVATLTLGANGPRGCSVIRPPFKLLGTRLGFRASSIPMNGAAP